jgi:metal-dependent amidase/aminoacylase/carboxypeptidase family protein
LEYARRHENHNSLLCSPDLSVHCPLVGQTLPSIVASEAPNLVETYKGLHTHPELSHHEEHTSALLAAGLREAGYTVTERVGKYPDGSQAYGVVANTGTER